MQQIFNSPGILVIEKNPFSSKTWIFTEILKVIITSHDLDIAFSVRLERVQ